VPEFLTGVSQYLEVDIKVHLDFQDHGLTALSSPLVARRVSRREILFRTLISSLAKLSQLKSLRMKDALIAGTIEEFENKSRR
jgi:hypothetical protein